MRESHGMHKTPEYSSWSAMKSRCNNPKARYFNLYGGRGIKVCQEWQMSFSAFFQHMGPRPSLAHSLDRWPDNNGDYKPGNCRWATPAEQAVNKRNTRLIRLRSEAKVLTHWARSAGLSPNGLRHRLSVGVELADAIQVPLRTGRKATILVKVGDKEQTINEWASELGLKPNTFRKRLRRQGWTPELAVEAQNPASGAAHGGKVYEFEGRSMTVTRWAQELGISRTLLSNRLLAGWTMERAVKTPRLR